MSTPAGAAPPAVPAVDDKKAAKAAKAAAKKAAKAAEAAEAKERGITVKELRTLKREEAQKSRAEAGKNDALFGDLPLIQSQKVTGRVWVPIPDLEESQYVDQKVLVRARVHKLRAQSQCTFFVLRGACVTIQAVLSKGKGVSKQFAKFADSIPLESIVDITATVVKTASPVTSTDIQGVELSVHTVHVVSRALPELPFQLDSAIMLEDEETVAGDDAATAGGAGGGAGAAAGPDGGDEAGPPRVGQKIRLDNRWIDLRRTAHQAIMRVSSGVCQEFRTFLLARKFFEIQTPKLLPGASEGGAEVFTTKYFGRESCLAQSPQLYKQMCAACSDFDRVFEIGPVFRAENSNTNRHLCEFHGLDMEMTINEHYHEVLTVFSDLFLSIFDNIHTKFKRELDQIRAVYPFENLEYCRPALRLTYAEGIAMLQADGATDADPQKDLSTPNEKRLGKLVKAKYGTDFFMMDRYPMAARPFYTMPCPDDASLSNSYDFFVRGEEILSGAQRIHDPALLVQVAKSKGVPEESIQSYVNSFKHGAFPHGGGGIGLERLVMLMLGLPNIRLASMFPRDPKRLAP